MLLSAELELRIRVLNRLGKLPIVHCDSVVLKSTLQIKQMTASTKERDKARMTRLLYQNAASPKKYQQKLFVAIGVLGITLLSSQQIR
eukprot:2270043-Amphidinium_carterae.1